MCIRAMHPQIHMHAFPPIKAHVFMRACIHGIHACIVCTYITWMDACLHACMHAFIPTYIQQHTYNACMRARASVSGWMDGWLDDWPTSYVHHFCLV